MTNMQILRIKANHYKNCSNGLHIDFVPTARKTEEDKTYELNQINDSLFVFSTTAIVGKNASGKTSLLKLIENVYQILGSFQLEDELMSISGTQLEITFYHEGRLFRYEIRTGQAESIWVKTCPSPRKGSLFQIILSQSQN